MMKVQADQKYINLEIINELEKLDLTIINDSNRFNQVQINLISNALKFCTKDTGQVTIRIKLSAEN